MNEGLALLLMMAAVAVIVIVTSILVEGRRTSYIEDIEQISVDHIKEQKDTIYE